MPENKVTLTVEQFKLICIDGETFTDDEVKTLFNNVLVENEGDLEEILVILQKYRSNLINELFEFDKIKPKHNSSASGI